MPERAISIVLLLICVYGGVWSVLEKPALVLLFVCLTVISVLTVITVWHAPVIGESEES